MLKKGDVTLVHVTRQYDDVMYTVDVESGEKEKNVFIFFISLILKGCQVPITLLVL